MGKATARHRACLEEPASGEPAQASVPDAPEVPDLQQTAIEAAARRAEESVLAIRTRQRYELVQSLKAQSKGIKPIKHETGLAKETVRRFYRAESVDELLAKVKDGRPSILDEHKPTCTIGGTRAAPTSSNSMPSSRNAATRAATAPSATTYCRSAGQQPPARCHRGAQSA